MMAEHANDVCKKFHPDLLEADLSIDSLTKELQNINLFTDDHVKELEACGGTQSARIQYILDHVIEPSLKSGTTKSFDIFLKVMEESDDSDLILLAKEMKILYNSTPSSLTELNDESSEPNSITESKVNSNHHNVHSDNKPLDSFCITEDCVEADHQGHTSPATDEVVATDEVDGGVKDALRSVAGVVFPKLKPKRKHDAATSESGTASATRNYGNIKQELFIIKKYAPTGRRSQPIGSPWLLAKGVDDMLFVRDFLTHQVVVFDNKLRFSHVIGDKNKFKSIGGIAVNNKTMQVYVADQLSNCVRKFQLNGQFVAQIGRKGIGNGEFRSPCGLLLSSTESLYVCDTNNHRIQVFHHNDVFAFKFGQRGLNPGSFDKPEALAMNNSEDNLFIGSDNRVQVFTIDGQFIKVFDHFRSASHKLITPVGICFTPDNHVMISSYGTHCVFVLKEDGTHVAVIKGSYQGKERFVFPAGVIVRDNGNIVIASSGNHQLAVF